MTMILLAFMAAFVYADYKLVRDFMTADASGRLFCAAMLAIITALAVLDGLILHWWAVCGGFSECAR
ncbi:hypothetical protein OM076_01430 [Solirubrobacter ginsenosidimutans]|uniref:Uncharacterized protein n=1 Tax=Solirubrobacter ginsenosidimutans TaxID=490573 RepID=A0A9X3RY82_9ACTN|nr:hypothetical protein [Solirubrobacter ginsenosidimutans]MDA0158909.1 hypothetical protein [Solirubrobacter ginsenosidimutans]